MHPSFPFLQGPAGFHGGTWLGRGKACPWNTSSLLFVHPSPTCGSLLLPSVDSGKGWDWWKAHMYPVTLVLHSSFNQGWHIGAISILVWKNSHPPVRLLCVSLPGVAGGVGGKAWGWWWWRVSWTRSPCCPAPGQKMFSGTSQPPSLLVQW